jgi:hypothetical protein
MDLKIVSAWIVDYGYQIEYKAWIMAYGCQNKYMAWIMDFPHEDQI